MHELDALPPDQRAVVQLVLQQGRSYTELGTLLGIPVASVRDRGRAGVAAAAGADEASEREAIVADWLLGQAPVPPGLEEDAEALGFARRAVAALSAVPGAVVPAVPEDEPVSALRAAATPTAPTDAARFAPRDAAGSAPKDAAPSAPTDAGDAAPAASAAAGAAPSARTANVPPSAPTDAGDAAPAASSAPSAGTADVPSPAPRPRERRDRDRRRRGRSSGADAPAAASRLGGAVLILALAAVVAVGVYLLWPSGDDERQQDAGTTATTPATTTTTPEADQPRAVGRIRLGPPDGGRGTGVMTVYAQGTRVAFTIEAKRLRPNGKRDAYAVWFVRKGGPARRLGFAEPVKADGALGLTGPQQADLARFPRLLSTYDRVVIAREVRQHAKRPGTVVLQGRLPGRS